MIAIDPYLVVRGGSLYLAVALTAAIWIWRRPGKRLAAGAMLGAAWNVPALLALNALAPRLAWWQFDAHGGLLLGVPVDLLFAWAWLWGAVPVLASPGLSLAAVAAVALAADLVLMPLAAPVVDLGPRWLLGEGVSLLIAFVPAQLLARWTARDVRLPGRALLQVGAFGALMMFVLPAIAIDASSTAWSNPFLRPAWHISLIVQLLAAPALLGLTAVQEFATRGGGTPVPFDPPKHLVTSGIYAYVRNPMQLSAVVMLVLLAIVIRNPWVAASAVMAHVYALGLAGSDEQVDLESRFGDAWIEYRGAVRSWMPRWRPRHPPGPPARLFVAESCGMCSEVGQWFARRGGRALVIVPAESHPSQALRRITYEPADGSRAASGVEAVARALEHVHFGWAYAGFLLRLPMVLPLVQLLVDASGGEPRTLANRATAR